MEHTVLNSKGTKPGLKGEKQFRLGHLRYLPIYRGLHIKRLLNSLVFFLCLASQYQVTD